MIPIKQSNKTQYLYNPLLESGQTIYKPTKLKQILLAILKIIKFIKPFHSIKCPNTKSIQSIVNTLCLLKRLLKNVDNNENFQICELTLFAHI